MAPSSYGDTDPCQRGQNYRNDSGKVRSTGIRLGADEVLVMDSRSRMTPGQFVEEKLRVALATSRRRGWRMPK